MMNKCVGFTSTFIRGKGELTFAVKDTLDVAGYPTQAGSRVFSDAQPALKNANVVELLLNDGCQLSGKTVLHELAFGVTGINSWSGTPINHHFPDLIPGGSSSGSATVVAAGCVDFAIGTDTGGSVRMPAACCAVVGLKPTWGVVSREGVLPPQSSLDCVGFFTRDTDMMLRVAEKVLASNKADVDALPAMGLMTGHASKDIDGLVSNRLEKLASTISPVNIPYFTDAHQAGLTVISHENWLAFSAIVDDPGLSVDVATRLRAGAVITQEELNQAEDVRVKFTQALDKQLELTPIIILPTLPELPPTLTAAVDPLNIVNLTRLVRPFNLSGHPAISVPIGEIDGRPVSMQMVTKKNHDINLCVYANKITKYFNVN